MKITFYETFMARILKASIIYAMALETFNG